MKSFIKKHLPFIANIYRKARDNFQLIRAPRRTPMGFRMSGGNVAMQIGTFEREEVRIFEEIIKDIDIFIDAGANVGYYCCRALQRGKHVIAFEPMPHNVYHLLKNISINGWAENAEVFPIALSDTSGAAKIYGSGTGASLIKGWAGFSSEQPLCIRTARLDDIIGDRLREKKALILIDVEGAEYALMKGAERLLTTVPKPIWMVEITTQEQQPDGVTINPNFLATFTLFREHGYEPYAIIKGGTRLLTHQEIHAMINAGFKQTCSHNFIFK